MLIESADLEAVTGFSSTDIRNFYRRGFLKPTFGRRGQAGVAHRFDLGEATFLGVLQRLTSRRKRIEEAVSEIREIWGPLVEWAHSPDKSELWAVTAYGASQSCKKYFTLPMPDDDDQESIREYWRQFSLAQNDALADLPERVLGFEALCLSAVALDVRERFLARAKAPDAEVAETPVIAAKVNA